MDSAFPVLLGAACLIGLCVLGFLAQRTRQKASNRGSDLHLQSDSPMEFLFERGVLVQTNPNASQFLGAEAAERFDWNAVRRRISELIDGLPETLSETEHGHVIYPTGADSKDLHALIEQNGSYTRFSIFNAGCNAVKAGQNSKLCLDLVADDAPFPIWKTNNSGGLIWSNKQYKTFDLEHAAVGEFLTKTESPDRMTVAPSGSASPVHFDVFHQLQEDGKIFYAINADQIVAAEGVRNEFVRTLGKTFAQISTGIAVFDRNPKLAMFNPALGDIFGFDPKFLSSGPTLQSFFDHMRDNRMIPEPRDYLTWREQMTNLILGAQDGNYCENWQLPSGQTIRVTGQPHPDGALGFLFEDISAEVSLTRRFRQDLTRAYGIMDALPYPIAAINMRGVVFFANQAFKDHWKADPESSFADFTTTDLLALFETSFPTETLNAIDTGLTSDHGAVVTEDNCQIHIKKASGRVTVVTQHPMAKPAMQNRDKKPVH